MKTLIVVPAYNEEERLAGEKFIAYLATRADLHLLFVNDGSTDRTREVLEDLRDRCGGQIEVLHLSENRGKAEAVRAGLRHGLSSGARYLGFWDADLATPLEAIPSFEQVLDERPECVLVMGARVKLLGRRIERYAMRHYLGRASATLISIVLGIPVYDTQCGSKLFRVTEELSEILAEPFLSRWVFDVEILARMIRRRHQRDEIALGGAIYELPLLEWRDIKGSKVSGGAYLKGLADLWKIYWGTLRAT